MRWLNGLPADDNGVIDMETVGAIVETHNGMPLTAAGKLAVATDGAVAVRRNGFGFTSDGRLCVTSSGAIAVSHNGFVFDSSRRLVVAGGTPAVRHGAGYDAARRVIAKGFMEFGFATGAWLRTMSAADRNADFDDMVAMGAKWVRVNADWWDVQGVDAVTYDWARLDAQVDAAVARGLKVLLVHGSTPPWARSGGGGWTPPTSNATFATFCTQVCNRYKPGGTKGYSAAAGVTAYEIWNEANIPAFWETGPSTAAYAALLTAAYDAIKAAQPAATVITAGTSPAPTGGVSPANTIAPTDFLSGIYAAGAGAKFDAVGHHPYCSPALPGEVQSWSAWHQMIGAATSLRSIMAAQGQSAKKLWMTEWGTFTNGAPGEAGDVQTEASQATHLQTAMGLVKTYDWSGPFFVYEHRDQNTADGGIDGNDATTRENHYGHSMHTDRSVKPARAAFIANV